MKIFLFKVFVLILLASCRPKPIDLELDPYEPDVVIASQIIPDHVMMVGLTRSFTVLSNGGYDSEKDSEIFNDLLVDSALVTIESESGIDTLFKLSPGLFSSINELENPGGAYLLKVFDYDLNKIATAISVMRQNVPIDTVIFSLNIEENGSGIDMFLSFKDIPNTANFYVLSVYSKKSNKGGLDLNTFFENGLNNIEYQELIEDKNKDGDTFIRSVNLSSVSSNDSLMILLSNISEGYYQFLKSRERSGNPILEFTNEPVNYRSNVNNGLGYFNTHYPSIRYFDVKELLD